MNAVPGDMTAGDAKDALAAAAQAWLDRFGAALAAGDIDAAAALFRPDGFWRDVLAFTWTLDVAEGPAAVADRLRRRLADTRPSGFRVAAGRTPPRVVSRVGRRTLEAIITFETAHGTGGGVLRLIADDADDPADWSDAKAWFLATALEDIAGHEEATGDALPTSEEDYRRDFGGENWLDRRHKEQAFADREPAVLVVGAGQAGLAIAARLRAVGIDALVIEKHGRVGDSWRKRYHALTLHNEVSVNHFPYMPFPPNFPVYIPKDMLANWFEHYADAMELNVWTGTELAGGSYDEAAGEWTVTVRGTDEAPAGGFGPARGVERILRPRHLVFAVGVSTIPKMPDLPGLGDFAGTVIHSGAYTNPHDWKGRRVLVLGTGNSGHDVAQDLATAGIETSMIQRAPTCIISIKEAAKAYALYFEGLPTADADTLGLGTSYPLLVEGGKMLVASARKVDQPLLDGLAARGFKTWDGPDGAGHRLLYPSQGGGYCLNVGASDMIIDGRIGLMHYDDIDRFVAEGVRLKDGSVKPADLLVMATGYYNQQEVTREYLGDAVADRIGPVWGFDDGGELRNMWRRTAQPGLWFTAGSLAQSRIYSKYLARLIKACELGLISPALDADDVGEEAVVRPLSLAGD